MKKVSIVLTLIVSFIISVNKAEAACNDGIERVLGILDETEHGPASRVAALTDPNDFKIDFLLEERTPRSALDLGGYNPDDLPLWLKRTTSVARPLLNSTLIVFLGELMGRYCEEIGLPSGLGRALTMLCMAWSTLAGDCILPYARFITRGIASWLDPSTSLIGHVANGACNLIDLALSGTVAPFVYALATAQTSGCDDSTVESFAWGLATVTSLHLYMVRSSLNVQRGLRAYRHSVAESEGRLEDIKDFLRRGPRRSSSYRARKLFENFTGWVAAITVMGLFDIGIWGVAMAAQTNCDTGEPSPGTKPDEFQRIARNSAAWSRIISALFVYQVPALHELGSRFGRHVVDMISLRDPLVALTTTVSAGSTVLVGLSIGDRLHSIAELMGTLSGPEPFVKTLIRVIASAFNNSFGQIFSTTPPEIIAGATNATVTGIEPYLTDITEGALATHGWHSPIGEQDLFRAAGTLGTMFILTPHFSEAARRFLAMVYGDSPAGNRLRRLSLIDSVMATGAEFAAYTGPQKPPTIELAGRRDATISVVDNPMRANGAATPTQGV